MTKISQINTTNNIVPSTKPKAQKAETAKVQPSCGNGVYPSGELLRTMAGVQIKETPKPQAAPKQGLFSKDTEDIKKYLYSLPITGQVIKAYEADTEATPAVEGLVKAMQKNDVETSNVEMLLDLVENKKVHYSALLYLCNQGMMSDEYEKDLDKLYDAYINGKNVKDTFVPTVKTTDEALKTQEIGDVFKVDGEDNIYIRTSENETKQLKMSKDTYLKLFPPLERFALYQGDAGNCYMLSCLDAINSNPRSREKLLSCFEEKGDRLNVSLPDSDYVFTMDKNKMPDEIKQYRDQFSMGSAGFKILEHVYGKDVQEHVTAEAHEILKDQSQHAKGFFKKRMFQKQLEQFEAALQENPDNVIVERKISDQSVSWNDSIGVEWSKLSETSPNFKRASDYYRGRGGHEEWVFQRFGFENTEKIFDFKTKNAEKLKDMLFNPANKDKYLFTAFSNGNGMADREGLVDKDYGVYSQHSFSVKPKVDKNGNNVLHISNPWNSTQSSVMTFEKFQELFSAVIKTDV